MCIFFPAGQKLSSPFFFFTVAIVPPGENDSVTTFRPRRRRRRRRHVTDNTRGVKKSKTFVRQGFRMHITQKLKSSGFFSTSRNAIKIR